LVLRWSGMMPASKAVDVGSTLRLSQHSSVSETCALLCAG
jgi:hypothetical protein